MRELKCTITTAVYKIQQLQLIKDGFFLSEQNGI